MPNVSNANTVAMMKAYINDRFRDHPEPVARDLRAVANDAVDRVVHDDHHGANIALGRLPPEAAKDIRAKLKELDIELKPAQ